MSTLLWRQRARHQHVWHPLLQLQQGLPPSQRHPRLQVGLVLRQLQDEPQLRDRRRGPDRHRIPGPNLRVQTSSNLGLEGTVESQSPESVVRNSERNFQFFNETFKLQSKPEKVTCENVAHPISPPLPPFKKVLRNVFEGNKKGILAFHWGTLPKFYRMAYDRCIWRKCSHCKSIKPNLNNRMFA